MCKDMCMDTRTNVRSAWVAELLESSSETLVTSLGMAVAHASDTPSAMPTFAAGKSAELGNAEAMAMLALLHHVRHGDNERQFAELFASMCHYLLSSIVFCLFFVYLFVYLSFVYLLMYVILITAHSASVLGTFAVAVFIPAACVSCSLHAACGRSLVGLGHDGPPSYSLAYNSLPRVFLCVCWICLFRGLLFEVVVVLSPLLLQLLLVFSL